MAETRATNRGSASSEALDKRETIPNIERETIPNIGPNGIDSSSFQSTVEKLNFREWAQSIQLIIDGKGKIGYLTGEVRKQPSTDTTTLQKWRSENSMVIAWLVKSKPSIRKTYLFLPTMKEVWDAVRETCPNAEHASQIFEIKARLWQMK